MADIAPIAHILSWQLLCELCCHVSVQKTLKIWGWGPGRAKERNPKANDLWNVEIGSNSRTFPGHTWEWSTLSLREVKLRESNRSKATNKLHDQAGTWTWFLSTLVFYPNNVGFRKYGFVDESLSPVIIHLPRATMFCFILSTPWLMSCQLLNSSPLTLGLRLKGIMSFC